MIVSYLNKNGYYIGGSDLEIIRSLSPSLNSKGEPLFHPLHHLYMVLASLLLELQGPKTSEDIIVYNDGRIIEELTGMIEPMDNICREFIKNIRGRIIPRLTGHIVFRKKSYEVINQKIKNAQQILNVRERDQKIKPNIAFVTKLFEENKRNRVKKFRATWLGKEDNIWPIQLKW